MSYSQVALSAKRASLTAAFAALSVFGSGLASAETTAATATEVHPDTSGSEWSDLFADDLSNAEFPAGVWVVEDGVFTASEDQVIWSEKEYENFTLDLEFKTGSGANSGVIVYATDIANWIPNSVEVQLTDDHHEKWATAPKTWQCGGVFGRLAPTENRVKKPGEWNRLTIRCIGQDLEVALNGAVVSSMSMADWSNAKTNPDGSEIPSWLSRPLSELATSGRIGLQGMHGGAAIYFRNVRINEQ